jgi:hypothetical protein|nr:SprT-like domain-containing protein [Neorhizobium tomejilense]
MFILGNVKEGYEPGDDTYVLTDGRVVGPFESAYAARTFGQWFGAKAASVFQASEIFEGSVVGDGYQLLRTDEASLATHPFREIHDVWIEPDNGLPVFEMFRGPKVTDPRELVLVESPERCQPRLRLGDRIEPEFLIDLEPHSKPQTVFPSKFHGEIAVFGYVRDSLYLVCWRRDGRRTQGVVGISLHTHLRLAEEAARQRAWDFKPPFEKRTNRDRDGQREKLYRWEHSFPTTFVPLADVEEARALANRITGDLGLPEVAVTIGRATLITKSYYRAGEIVLNRQMMDNQTLIHEAAHYVTRKMPGIKEPSHGPVFAGVLLALMVEYMDADVEFALDNARERGVVVNLDIMRAVQMRIADNRSTADHVLQRGVTAPRR